MFARAEPEVVYVGRSGAEAGSRSARVSTAKRAAEGGRTYRGARRRGTPLRTFALGCCPSKSDATEKLVSTDAKDARRTPVETST